MVKTIEVILSAVEGTWVAWSSWGSCSTSCNSGSRTRSRSYNGGQPCTGSSTDTGNCDSASRKDRKVFLSRLHEFPTITVATSTQPFLHIIYSYSLLLWYQYCSWRSLDNMGQLGRMLWYLQHGHQTTFTPLQWQWTLHRHFSGNGALFQ